MAACGRSLENIGKMNLKPVLNKTSPWAHTELELDVLGVLGKLVKYVVHLFIENSKNKNSSHKLPKLQSTRFWSQGILGINLKYILAILVDHIAQNALHLNVFFLILEQVQYFNLLSN
jgi:hypothetical protein